MRTDDARRAALRSWLEEQRPALEQADWGVAFRGYPALDLTGEPVPWTPFTGDPAAARIALVTSAGVFVQGRQEPFDAANPYGDLSSRPIPLATPPARLGLAHEHYDHAAAARDLNVVYPVDRLRELAQAGMIGAVLDPSFSVMGYNPDWAAVQETCAPALADQVAALRPDAALLVPV